MPLQAIIKHGNLPEVDGLVDEPYMLVQSLEINAERTEKEYLAASTKAVGGLLLTNPKLNFVFDAIISEHLGLSNQHPGTAVDELANYQASIMGFDPAEGMLIYREPSQSRSVENPDGVKFTVTHYPFLVAAESSD